MPHQIYRLSFLLLLRPLLSFWVLILLLTHSCKGQSHLIGQPGSILTGIGDEIISPCHLKPAMDVNAETIEWTRPDLEQRFVHVRRSGQDLVNIKNPSYKGRTSLFPGELKQGNISLKLCKVQLSDQGTYVCDIPLMNKKSSVRLVVALHTASVSLISISGIDRNRGGVILNCDSNSWYPEPEVFWLDGEGNLVSTEPTETVRGPDDLYTVSSRVTVERRHSNSFTCRVQQNHSNQTRETHIHVPDDFFEVQSSSYSTTVGLVVSLVVCILVILILGCFVWKWRQIIFRMKADRSKCRKSKDQCGTGEETERQQLMTHETVQTKDLNKGQAAGIRPEFEKQQAEVQQLQEQIQKMETDLQTLMEDLQSDTLEDRKKHIPSSKSPTPLWPEMLRQKFQEKLQKKITELQEEHDRRDKADKDVLKKELQSKTHQKEVEVQQLQEEIQKMETNLKSLTEKLQSNNKEFEKQQAEVQQLQEEIQKMEISLQSLMEDLESDIFEISLPSQAERRSAGPVRSSSSSWFGRNRTTQVQSVPLSQWPFILRQKFQEKLQKKITEKQNSSSLSQNSTAEPLVLFKVDPHGKYFQLKNKSSKDQQLGGWNLKIQLNNDEPIIRTFRKPFNLKTGEVFTVGYHDYWGQHYPTDLVLKELLSWSYKDNLQVSLISHPGEIQYNLDRVY